MFCGGCFNRPAKVAVLDATKVLKNDWRLKQVEENKKFLPSTENSLSPVPAFSKNFFLQFQRSLAFQQDNESKLYQQSLKAYFEQLQEQQLQFGKQEELLLRQKLKEKQQEEVKHYEQEVSSLKGKYEDRFQGLKTELQKNYEEKKLNLELKLKTLRLSSPERTKTEKELENLISKMEGEERAEKEGLKQQFDAEQKNLERESTQKLRDFKEALEKEASEKLKARELMLQSKFMQKQAQHQAGLTESKGRQNQMLLSTRHFLTLLPSQSKPTPPNVYTVTLQKQNEELLQTAMSDMNSLLKGIARTKNYDLILANVLATGSATDITDTVKQKLNFSHE